VKDKTNHFPLGGNRKRGISKEDESRFSFMPAMELGYKFKKKKPTELIRRLFKY
jgi:hypothetical protein